MPIEIPFADQDVLVSAKECRSLRIPMRTDSHSRRAVAVLRVIIGPALQPWVHLTAAPAEVPAAARPVELLFEILPGLTSFVSGELEIHVEEAGLTAVRVVPVCLVQEQPFQGVFALDLGGTCIAAATLDPASGQIRPHLIHLAGRNTTLPSTFAAQFREGVVVPQRMEIDQFLQPVERQTGASLFFCPRRRLGHSLRRPAWPGCNLLIDEIDSLAWQVAHVARLASRTPRMGLPREITVPLPGGLTAPQVTAFRDAVDRIPELRGKVRCSLEHGESRGWLDEASAIAFSWLSEQEEELRRRCEKQGKCEVGLLVVDAGSSSIDLAVLQIQLHLTDQGRLVARPTVEVRDSFPWLAGDSVTAVVFAHLKQRAAEDVFARNSVSTTGGEDRVDAVLPTRFHNRVGGEYMHRVRNFWVLWRKAEEVKQDLGAAVGLLPFVLRNLATELGSRDAGVTIRPDGVGLVEQLQPACNACLERIRAALIRDRGTRSWFRIDELVVSGGASLLPLFARHVTAPLFRELQDLRQGNVRLREHGRQSKEVVACGAALAVYHRDHAPAVDDPTAEGVLAMEIDRFDLRLPFHITYLTAGSEPRILYPRGSEFDLDAQGQPLPLRPPEPPPSQLRMSLWRHATYDLSLPAGQYLGEVDISAFVPPGAEEYPAIDVVLYPDLRLAFSCQGQPCPLIPPPGGESDDPFQGLL